MRTWVSVGLGMLVVATVITVLFYVKFMKIWDSSVCSTESINGNSYEVRVFRWNQTMATFGKVYAIMLSFQIWKEGYLVGPVSAGGYDSEVHLYKKLGLTNR
jgi:hypothetical protein